MDYGKYKFESQKKANQAKKKQKTIAIKEIKLRPNIDVHDYQVKMRSVQKGQSVHKKSTPSIETSTGSDGSENRAPLVSPLVIYHASIFGTQHQRDLRIHYI